MFLHHLAELDCAGCISYSRDEVRIRRPFSRSRIGFEVTRFFRLWEEVSCLDSLKVFFLRATQMEISTAFRLYEISA